jgi:hypothetical protein
MIMLFLGIVLEAYTWISYASWLMAGRAAKKDKKMRILLT